MKIIDMDGTEVTLDSETVAETFERWNREFKRDHPILFKIDQLFKDKGYLGRAPHYLVTHPWFILQEWGRRIKWAWQRAFRGWDDTVIWSIDYYLAEMLPVWIRQLKEDKHGVPGMIFTKKELSNPNGISDKASKRAEKVYDNILEEIAIGFEAYIKMNDTCDYKSEEYKAEEGKFKRAFYLLEKYFGTLWD